MKSINISMSLALILVLTNVPIAGMAQEVAPVAACFTLERGKDCGTSGTGSTITCEDGSAGPAFVRIAHATYKCKSAPPDSGGQKKCNNTGDTVAEKLITFSCAGGTYGPSGTTELSTCKSAKLDGSECRGSANAVDELLSILDSFE